MAGATDSRDDHRPVPVRVPTTIAVFAMLSTLVALAGDGLVAAAVSAFTAVWMLLLRRHLLRRRRAGRG